MGVIFCADKSSPRDVNDSYKFDKSNRTQETAAPGQVVSEREPQHKISAISAAGSVDLREEEKDVFVNSIGMPIKNIKSESIEDARSCTASNSSKARTWNTSESQQRLQISYSSMSNVQEQTLLVDEALMEALSTPQQHTTAPINQKFSLSRRSNKSMSNVPKKKKVRFNETVTIHRITYSDVRAPHANPVMYKLVIGLREVWKKLDIDEDDHLNMSELRRFCQEVWEEPIDDGGSQKIMNVYAQAEPEKGMKFKEWCLLIKDEDPDLQEFVEELYEIFVDPTNSRLITDSEMEP